MPSVNEIKYAYGRVYRFIKPNNTDPGTWRLSVPETGTGSPGLPPTPTVSIVGEAPIVANTTGNTTNISFNISSLADRATNTRTDRSMNIVVSTNTTPTATQTIVGEAPIVANTNGTTTTVSFNIADLDSKIP